MWFDVTGKTLCIVHCSPSCCLLTCSFLQHHALLEHLVHACILVLTPSSPSLFRSNLPHHTPDGNTDAGCCSSKLGASQCWLQQNSTAMVLATAAAEAAAAPHLHRAAVAAALPEGSPASTKTAASPPQPLATAAVVLLQGSAAGLADVIAAATTGPFLLRGVGAPTHVAHSECIPFLAASRHACQHPSILPLLLPNTHYPHCRSGHPVPAHGPIHGYDAPKKLQDCINLLFGRSAAQRRPLPAVWPAGAVGCHIQLARQLHATFLLRLQGSAWIARIMASTEFFYNRLQHCITTIPASLRIRHFSGKPGGGMHCSLANLSAPTLSVPLAAFTEDLSLLCRRGQLTVVRMLSDSLGGWLRRQAHVGCQPSGSVWGTLWNLTRGPKSTTRTSHQRLVSFERVRWCAWLRGRGRCFDRSLSESERQREVGAA